MSSHPPRLIAHLTTVDLSLRYLLLAQIDEAIRQGHEVVGISARGPDVPFLQGRGMRFIELPGSTRAMDPWADVRARDRSGGSSASNDPTSSTPTTPSPVSTDESWAASRVCHESFTPPTASTPHLKIPLRLRLVVYALEAIASRFSHVELVQNPEDLALMNRLRLAPRRKLRLLGNGVDLERFRPADSQQDQPFGQSSDSPMARSSSARWRDWSRRRASRSSSMPSTLLAHRSACC